MIKIFEINKSHYKLLSEMIGEDGKIISGALTTKNSETSINTPNDEGRPPITTDIHMRQATQPPTAFRYGAFWITGGIGGITEGKLEEDKITTLPKKPTDLINKPLTKEDVIQSFPLTEPLFKRLTALVSNINEISTLDYTDNVEQIKIAFIREMLEQINYNIMSPQNKKLIFNSKNG